MRCHLGRATHRLLQINNTYTTQNIAISNPVYFEKEVPFKIGDITITPFWADHSAFDAYSFLIESEGKSIFYSGDFRGHGRKRIVFEWFSHNAPANVDYLLLEGTSLGRGGAQFKTESDIEGEFENVFRVKGKSNLVYTSGQNIDRIVSIYRACVKAKKTLIVDVYVATILKELSTFARIPNPSKDFDNVRVLFPYVTSRRLKNQGDEKILYQFRNFKVTKQEISADPDKYVILVRPSMQKDLEYISGIDGGNFIYSMWEGYKSKSSTKRFLKYFESRNFTFYEIHTSGHADIETLKKMVEALKPKTIIPIHTFHADDYSSAFDRNVKVLPDGDTASIL